MNIKLKKNKNKKHINVNVYTAKVAERKKKV